MVSFFIKSRVSVGNLRESCGVFGWFEGGDSESLSNSFKKLVCVFFKKNENTVIDYIYTHPLLLLYQCKDILVLLNPGKCPYRKKETL